MPHGNSIRNPNSVFRLLENCKNDLCEVESYYYVIVIKKTYDLISFRLLKIIFFLLFRG